MVAVENYRNEFSEFNARFKLDDSESVFDFCTEDKRDSAETLRVKVNQAFHYFKTGVWINEKAICEWSGSHPRQKMSVLFSGHRLERKLIRYEQGMVVPKPSFWTSFRQKFSFLGRYFHDSKTIGAVLPSSSSLAKKIASRIPKDLHAKPRRILEIGPGTGVFTDRILRRTNPGDEIHLVEFDQKLYEGLREKYKNFPNVKVYHMSILDYKVPEDKRYDYVVSGLPLNSFPVSMVRSLFKHFPELTVDGGEFSDFEYLVLPRIKKMSLFMKEKERMDFEEILRIKKQFYRQYGDGVDTVLLNVPPAKVLHHCITASNSVA